MSAHTPFAVFSGTNSRYLAEKICNSLGCSMGQMNIEHFSDGEFSVSYEESIRGKDVFFSTIYIPQCGQPDGTPADDGCRQTCFGTFGHCRHSVFRMGASRPER